MEMNAIIGLIIIAGALCVSTLLVLWSRRRIRRIADRGYESARGILRNFKYGG
ncbi:MAG: hypothetical protein SVT52_03660 [Planctomycetota bacterium]|nr:hypothetical protein [Planctomycetota bacterium]